MNNPKTRNLAGRKVAVEPVWDSHQAGKFLKLHPRTITRMARERHLPAFQLGNRWRFRPSDLDSWIRTMVAPRYSSLTEHTILNDREDL